MKRATFLAIVMFLTGCASGGHPPGKVMPTALVGLHLDTYDLLLHPNIVQRSTTYLDEIIASNKYAKEIRIMFGYEEGQWLLDTLIPVVRAKGFKILPILSRGNQTRPYNTAADLAWLELALPKISDLLIGVQLGNEQWQKKIEDKILTPFPPAEYVQWHNALTPTIRRLAPGVPIVDGDIDGGWDNAMDWWKAIEAKGGVDIDFLSWHVYTSELPPTYGHRVWITESGDAEMCVEPAEKCFVFAWNFEGRFAKRPGGGILPE